MSPYGFGSINGTMHFLQAGNQIPVSLLEILPVSMAVCKAWFEQSLQRKDVNADHFYTEVKANVSNCQRFLF